jgi:hypothetical protein
MDAQGQGRMNVTARASARPFVLRAARWLMLALIAATLLAVLASLLLAPAYVRTHGDKLGPTTNWTPAQRQAALAALGWPADTIAWFDIVRNLVAFTGFLVPGLLILRRKSQDWFGLYVTVAFIVAPAIPLLGLLPGLESLALLLSGVSWQLYFILFYFFPDGHFVPRWTRWLVPVWVGSNFIADRETFERYPVFWVVPLALVFSALGSQLYRYLRRADAVQRQQTKLVVLALVVSFALTAPLGPSIQKPSPGQAIELTMVLELSRQAAITLLGMMVPAAFAVAVFRYRLWDIDLLIRRTLIYSVLTGLLALVYLGSVLIIEGLLRGMVGSNSPISIVVSTLVVAALFGPLRGRVQQVIDQRFFRRKYDAARTLANFGAQARDETNLEQLSEHLVAAVDNAMQPAQVGLWMRPLAEAASGTVHPAGASGAR